MSQPYDVAVIGGGASGLAAAIAAAHAGARTVVLERDVACGLPILATGNGRCNLSNERIDFNRYLHPVQAQSVMGSHPEIDLSAFFESVGIVTAAEDTRLYPVSRRADSVRDSLLGSCSRLGVKMLCGCKLLTASFDRKCSTWSLTASIPARPLKAKKGASGASLVRNLRKALAAAQTTEVEVCAKSVVIACGGSSEELCRQFDLPHIDEFPVLSPVAASVQGEPNALSILDGTRAHAGVTLRRKGEPLWSESGEVLFRSYGISGIVAFNLSRRVQTGDAVLLDLMPQYSNDELYALLQRRNELLGTFTPSDPSWFDGMLAAPLARVACAICTHAHPGDPDVAHVVNILKHLKLDVQGLAEERTAQVRRGGIPLSALTLKTLRLSTVDAPLFACGEALDMDADCGGFNLSWAWLSGMRAGKAAYASVL